MTQIINANQDQEAKRAWRDALSSLRPPPDRTADQWADQCRILPASSAEPGMWRSSRTPYVIDIMRACANPRYRRIVVVMGSQMGKTEALFNVICWRLDDDPVPMMYVSPNQKLAESIADSRVMPIFRSIKSIMQKLSTTSQMKNEKFVGGVRLGFAWAGSATELSSHPCGLVVMDEVDRMIDLKAEGDPVELCEARITTHADGKLIAVSTPLIEGESRIMRLYEEGTKGRWAWPCKKCGEYFVLEFSLMKWMPEVPITTAARSAYIECPHCGAKIEQNDKKIANERGKFLFSGGAIDAECASFWVSGIASPWQTLPALAGAWLRAVASKDVATMQAVINTKFGEPFSFRGDAPEWESVAALREGYQFLTLPDGVQGMTMAVDVGKLSIYYVIRGWGANLESWLIDAGQLHGETAFPTVWQTLGGIVMREIGGQRISRVFVDSGYRTGAANMVYVFCRQFPDLVFPTKGHNALDKPFKASMIDVYANGVTVKNGLQLWHIDTDAAKSWVFSRISWPAGESGGWHLPSDANDDYCKQVVAEARTILPSGIAKWIKIRQDNHFLDCESMAYMAAKTLRWELLTAKNEPIAAKIAKRSSFRVLR